MALTRGAALDFLAKRFGGLLRDYSAVTTVGTSVVNIFGNDSERVFVAMTNLGASDLYVSPLNDVSSAKGILISANGGLVSFNVDEDGIMPTLEWWALGDAVGLTLFTIHVKRETLIRDEEEG